MAHMDPQIEKRIAQYSEDALRYENNALNVQMLGYLDIAEHFRIEAGKFHVMCDKLREQLTSTNPLRYKSSFTLLPTRRFSAPKYNI